jgi:hypothetical protein
MAHAKPVHRPLTLATPVEKGADVKALQSAVNKQFKHLKIDRAIAVDGDFGAQTFRAAKQAAVCLGATGPAVRKLKRGTLSEGTQKLLRGRKLTTGEAVVAKARAPYRRKLRKRFAASPGQKAVTAGRKLVGVHEVPAGSNWGGKVEQFIRFTGYPGPVFWCGCFACWVVVKLGGAKIPNRIRLGYAPYITADALAGRNGLTAVPAAEARPGDIACFWGGQHIEVIAGKPNGGTVECLGGNTSTSGKENNGGAVCLNRRSLSDFDSGIVARPAY